MITEIFQRPERITVKAEFTDDGVLFDPATSIKVTIKDPMGVVVVNAGTMTVGDVGKYSYNYDPATTITLGKWEAEVTGNDSGALLIDRKEFTVE